MELNRQVRLNSVIFIVVLTIVINPAPFRGSTDPALERLRDLSIRQVERSGHEIIGAEVRRCPGTGKGGAANQGRNETEKGAEEEGHDGRRRGGRRRQNRCLNQEIHKCFL